MVINLRQTLFKFNYLRHTEQKFKIRFYSALFLSPYQTWLNNRNLPLTLSIHNHSCTIKPPRREEAFTFQGYHYQTILRITCFYRNYTDLYQQAIFQPHYFPFSHSLIFLSKNPQKLLQIQFTFSLQVLMKFTFFEER